MDFDIIQEVFEAPDINNSAFEWVDAFGYRENSVVNGAFLPLILKLNVFRHDRLAMTAELFMHGIYYDKM